MHSTLADLHAYCTGRKGTRTLGAPQKLCWCAFWFFAGVFFSNKKRTSGPSEVVLVGWGVGRPQYGLWMQLQATFFLRLIPSLSLGTRFLRLSRAMPMISPASSPGVPPLLPQAPSPCAAPSWGTSPPPAAVASPRQPASLCRASHTPRHTWGTW